AAAARWSPLLARKLNPRSFRPPMSVTRPTFSCEAAEVWAPLAAARPVARPPTRAPVTARARSRFLTHASFVWGEGMWGRRYGGNGHRATNVVAPCVNRALQAAARTRSLPLRGVP